MTTTEQGQTLDQLIDEVLGAATEYADVRRRIEESDYCTQAEYDRMPLARDKFRRAFVLAVRAAVAAKEAPDA